MTTQPLTVGNVAIRARDGLYSLNDLHRASGNEAKHRPGYFLGNAQTQALIAEMQAAGIPASKITDTVIGKGKAQGTYACRELVIAYAAWISAAFHLKVIRVFLDTVAPEQAVAPPPSTYTIEQAWSLAQQTAGVIADKVYRAALAGRFDNVERCLFLISGNGTKVTPVDVSAFVLTRAQIIEAFKTGDIGAGFTNTELTQLAQAVLDRIKFRLDKPALAPVRHIAHQSVLPQIQQTGAQS